ncbi:Uncharacterised protein [uncultured archaeon]|nr:Uncharacterised protein [uncultured archaeon]
MLSLECGLCALVFIFLFCIAAYFSNPASKSSINYFR